MQAGPEDRVQKGILLCRGLTSLLLTFFTWILTLSAIIGITVDYGNILMSDQGCGMKAAFGLFVCADCCMFFLIVWDGVNLCMLYYTKGCCHCECYHMNFSFQIASFGMLLVGTIIYGSKDPDKIGWAFWFCLTSALLCLIVGIMWCMTQQMKRFIKGPASGSLGGMNAGGFGGGLDTGMAGMTTL